jgi:hypothetical protein
MSTFAKSADVESREINDFARPVSAFADIPTLLKEILAQDARECPLSRNEIADALTKASGRHITEAQIDAMLAKTKADYRFPAEMIPAWVLVTGSRRALNLICEAAGLSVATDEDKDFAALGRAKLRDEKLSRKLWGTV